MAASFYDRGSVSGSVPETYNEIMVPLLFQPYANDLVDRLKLATDAAVLELAAGTGVVTRRLREQLPSSVSIVCTDISDAMLTQAKNSIEHSDNISFQTADASHLAFKEDQFDAVICQFGLMFLPDKAAGIAEVARVLKRKGVFAFNVWDAIERNALAQSFQECLLRLIPEDPPKFLRTPYGYNDLNEITRTLQLNGFGEVEVAILPKQSVADRTNEVVRGQIFGSPLLAELSARNLDNEQTYAAIEKAIEDRFGPGPIAAPMQALTFVARRT